MIDPTISLQYLTSAADDPETAVILLDIVLGFCAQQNPASVYSPAILQAREKAKVAGRSLLSNYLVMWHRGRSTTTLDAAYSTRGCRCYGL